MNKNITETLASQLEQRKKDDMFRYLQVRDGLLDFCSNDYLGFSRSVTIRNRAEQLQIKFGGLNGSTGSRSISGNTSYAEQLEKYIAEFHGAEAGLLFNSGYDANVGLFSCIAGREDTLITDELIHASIIDGCRLSHAARYKFAHNDVADLEKKLAQAKGNIFVAVESVYSMDGDMAPLAEISRLCEKYGAALIVDEAHATGVFGENGHGLVQAAGLENKVYGRVHTFGKAMGCHGAVVIGPAVLRDYLINYARSFIFTTALPLHSLFLIRAAYDELLSDKFDNSPLHELVRFFRANFTPREGMTLIESESPVQCVVIPGAAQCRQVSAFLQENGFDVRAIMSPSVPKNKERLRISLHLHNTKEEVEKLLELLRTADAVQTEERMKA